MRNYLFSELRLPDELVRDLERQNPWWQNQPLPEIPRFRRWPYDKLRQRLDQPIAPIVVVKGPRQIGKTTLQLQLIQSLLEEGVDPRRIIRVQFDDLPVLSGLFKEPILRIVEWFEKNVLGATLNAQALRKEPVFLFFDEVQNLGAWDVQLKSLVDHVTARVMVTGSSALWIEKGRDSLAGRILSLEVGTLRLAEIAALRHFGELRPLQTENGWQDWLSPHFWRELVKQAEKQAPVLAKAFSAFSRQGTYPLAQVHADLSWEDISSQLNETVVKRVIEHDLRVGERGRKRDPQLLEEVFRMGCRYIGQSPNPATLARETQRVLSANIGPQRIRHYLEFLDSSLLLRTIKPLEIRFKKRHGYSKLCLCDHALRAAWLREVIPLEPAALEKTPHLSDLAGRIAESTVGYFLSSLNGPGVAHLPERGADPEVDFILTIGAQRIPVEVKYRRVIDPLADTIGLRTFIEKSVNHATFGILISQDDAPAIKDPRIITVPLPALLMVR
ncbi:ATP-binding protein [candidate division FCPU426 bacterium]|nr:ATP-binding protein [candidate division FCPU426 bacterium]